MTHSTPPRRHQRPPPRRNDVRLNPHGPFAVGPQGPVPLALHGGGRRRRAGRPRRLAGTRPRQGAEGPRHQLRQPHQDDDLAGHLLHDRARHRVGPQGRQRRPRGRPRPRLLRHHVDVRAGHRPGRRQPDPPRHGAGHPHDVQGGGRWRGRGRPGRLHRQHHPDDAGLAAGRRVGAVQRCSWRC